MAVILGLASFVVGFGAQADGAVGHVVPDAEAAALVGGDIITPIEKCNRDVKSERCNRISDECPKDVFCFVFVGGDTVTTLTGEHFECAAGCGWLWTDVPFCYQNQDQLAD